MVLEHDRWFDSVSPLFDDDDAIEAVWKKQYPLAEFSGCQLRRMMVKTRLDAVLSGTVSVGNMVR